jgi:imidazolonepropionase-like amidohydrolase
VLLLSFAARLAAWGLVLPGTLAAAAADLPQPLLLTGARILDPAGEKLLDGRVVLISAGRIQCIAPPAEINASADAIRIALDGLALLPGLIDLHSHLLLHPYNEASWDDQVLRESLELRTIRAVAAAKATIESGFTTLRDLGTEGAGFADVALRDAIAAGIVPGPRIFASTRAIVATGCYGPDGFDPRWSIPKGAQEADGVDGLRRAVREQVAAGADWIKVYADYRRHIGEPATPTFSQAELDALVDEAGSAGRPVVAHATTPEGMRRATLAGVATIEHGYGATDDVLKLLRERGVVLCPTLAASEAMARYAAAGAAARPAGAASAPLSLLDPRIVQSRQMFKRALEWGVTIACGSDVGVFPHGDSARELELMVDYGMSPAAAIRSATIVAARVLGRADELGRIAPGFTADLLAVHGDPLTDISALRQPAVVIKDGRLIIDRR